MHWYLHVMRNYANFSGRARRREYWMFQLANLPFVLVWSWFEVKMAEQEGVADLPTVLMLAFLALYSLVHIIPSLAVFVRRLHDTGHSGWWIFLSLVPLLGPVILFLWQVRDSEPGENRWGPNPKGVEAVLDGGGGATAGPAQSEHGFAAPERDAKL